MLIFENTDRLEVKVENGKVIMIPQASRTSRLFGDVCNEREKTTNSRSQPGKFWVGNKSCSFTDKPTK